MKKMLCMFLISFVKIGILSTPAFADEILFRGIPWYASMTDVKASFSDDSIIVAETDEALQVYYSKIDGNMHNASLGMTRYPAGWVAYSYLEGQDFKVAGYGLSDMTFYCCYGLDENRVNRKSDNSRLYLASYTFGVVDKRGAFEDLKAKLSSIYGEGKESSESGFSYIIEEADLKENEITEYRAEWNGDNNTAAVLVFSESELSNDDLFHHYLVLTYGKTDSDTMVQSVCDAVEAECVAQENQSRTNSTYGL